MPYPSTKDNALRNPTAHAFVRGAGFIGFDEYEQRELVYGPYDNSGSCMPSVRAAEGSRHLLRPPNGNEPLMFVWAAGDSWLRWGGKRLAFTARYLGSYGWTYIRPV